MNALGRKRPEACPSPRSTCLALRSASRTRKLSCSEISLTLRSALKFANVTAALALFLALAGVSYAAIKVTGADVVDGSLKGKDLKDESVTGRDVRSLTNRDVKNGSLLVDDFAAGQLPGPGSGVPNVIVRTAPGVSRPACPPGETCPSLTLSNTVSCRPGERALGGGIASGAGDGAAVLSSTPTPATDGAAPTGWSGSARTGAYGGMTIVASPAVWVLCAVP